MTHTCLSCDARVDFATHRLEIAVAGRYRHLDWQDCQAAFLFWRPGALLGWAQSKNRASGPPPRPARSSLATTTTPCSTPQRRRSTTPWTPRQLDSLLRIRRADELNRAPAGRAASAG